MSILEAALEMLENAEKNRRKPLRWEINGAGLLALAHCDYFARDASYAAVIDRPLFNLPMLYAPDKSSDPKLCLIVDELPNRPSNKTALNARCWNVLPP